MRILHTSDWHLGMTDCGRSLHEDQAFFISEICRIVETQEIGAVLIAGDVYDRSVASSEAIRLYNDAMTRLCLGSNVPVVVIAGNHDGAERLESCSELLAASKLFVCGTLRRELCKVDLGDTEVFLLPWITEETVKSVYPENKDEIAGLDDAYRVVISKIREDFDPDKKHLLLAHAFITDSETSTSDRAAVIGTAMQIPAVIFDAFDYVALGHIHKPQNVNDRIRYSGTPMPYSFGKEETQKKSVTIVDTETMEHTIIPLHPLHKRTTLTGTLEELLHPDEDEEIIHGFVKLKVTDKPVGLSSLTQLREIYPILMECESRSFEIAGSTIKLTAEEYEEMQTDPFKVFNSFCMDICDAEPDEHLLELFENAVKISEGAAQ